MGSMAGYSREEFPHWAADGTEFGWKEPDGSCDVRDDALIRDGLGIAIDEGEFPGESGSRGDATRVCSIVSGAEQDSSRELRSPFNSTTGGVMTVEAGAITGELVTRPTADGNGIRALVTYAGARDLYTVAAPRYTPSARKPTKKSTSAY